VRSTELKGRVTGVGASEVFERLGHFDHYAELGPSIRSIEVEQVDDLTLRTKWDVDFRGGSMRWTEEDRLDPEAGTISFDLVEGNLKSFKGRWLVTDVDGGSEVSFAVEFAIGMPSMASFIDPLAENAIRENLGAVLQGLFGDAYEPLD
jgi:ribosome-associated toxin RatA of RatAB toxin-antitoxin module